MAGNERGATTLQSLSDDLAAAVERAARSVVAIHARQRIPSSGIVWKPGVVVAASHTVKHDRDVAVTLPDGSRGSAAVAGRDGGTDIVVLRLEGASPEPAALAPDDALRVGALALAVGRPGDEGVTASLGLLSAVGGAWRTWAGGEIDRFVRLDLAVYDGFSGGPLVDAQGRVLGMNCSALARGMPVTIPGATVSRVVEALLTSGRVARGWLGVAMQPVRFAPAMAERAGVGGGRGVLLVQVEPEGPAERAGLLLGDVVVSIDGTAIEGPEDVVPYLGSDRVGKALRVVVVRAGARHEASVVVGERPRRAEG